MITTPQADRTDDELSTSTPGGSPRWWTQDHTSAWEKVKQAFRRDWEQTKADFSADAGRKLNQNAADTIEQAVGAQPVLPLDVKTRPTDPKDAAKAEANAAEHAAKATAKAVEATAEARAAIDAQYTKLTGTIGDARNDVVVHEQKASEAISEAQQSALEAIQKERAKMEKVEAKTRGESVSKQVEATVASHVEAESAIADARAKLTEKVRDVRAEQAERAEKVEAKIASAREDAAAEIGKQNEKINQANADRDAAMAQWRMAEQEARYGHAVRTQYPRGQVWDDSVEARLRGEWDGLGTNRSWEHSKAGVRRGWDFAGRS